jgi:hypothetical protein
VFKTKRTHLRHARPALLPVYHSLQLNPRILEIESVYSSGLDECKRASRILQLALSDVVLSIL